MSDSVRREKLEGEFRGGNLNNEKMERKEIDLEHMVDLGPEGDNAVADSGTRDREGVGGNDLGGTPAGSQGSGQPVSPTNGQSG